MLLAASYFLQVSIPAELTPRVENFTFELGIALSVAFLLMAIARLARPEIYYALSVGMLKTTGLRAHIRETMPVLQGGSLLLLVNYWLSSAIMLYLWLGTMDIPETDLLIISAAIPLLLLFGHMGSLVLTGWITGESDVVKEPVIMKLLGAQVMGVVYFICALIWVLSTEYHDVLINVIIWTFILEAGVRIIKSIATVYANGVAWYYIILYFCTLEILPLFVVYYYVLQNFSNV